MQDPPSTQPETRESDLDRPRSVAALFETEAEGISALERLHAAGFKKAWLGVTRAQKMDRLFRSSSANEAEDESKSLLGYFGKTAMSRFPTR